MITDKCETCGKPPPADWSIWECSHVSCQHRRVAWSERPNPAYLYRGPWEPNADKDPDPLPEKLSWEQQ